MYILSQVQLIVNTASGCSSTPQYGGLESLHREFALTNPDELCVVGIPSNEFNQEPMPDGELHKAAKRDYGVNYPLLARIDHINDHGNLL